MTPESARLRTFILFDASVAAAGVAFILVVWMTVVPSPYLLVLAVVVAASGALMLAGLRPLRSGDRSRTVLWWAVANWSVAVGASAIATFAWPILFFAALLPAVQAVPCVAARSMYVHLGVSFVVASTVVTLGVLQDFSGLTDDLPRWVRQGVTIVFAPCMGALVVHLGLANRAHLQRALTEAMAANRQLRRSGQDLAAVAEELRASRARVVAATDAERQRIARDLHDGAQQRLTALGMGLSLTSELLASSPGRASESLAALRHAVAEAQAELRGLVHRIYPPVLVLMGVAEALRSEAGRFPGRIRLAVDDVGRHRGDVEAAVYFCCAEALQNVAKHAGPDGAVCVSLEVTGAEDLRFTIVDDGRGFDPATVVEGAGFVSMRDRVGALGGTLTVTSSPGGGTQVRGVIPAGTAGPTRHPHRNTDVRTIDPAASSLDDRS
ncbi:MAG: sensor histidine kinase [Acidimicrobiales bacterium]